MAQACGINPLTAGKLTGLASYGDPNNLYEKIKPLFGLSPDKEKFILPPLYRKFMWAGIYKEVKHLSKKDVAAAVQKRFEDVIIEYVQNILQKTGEKNIMVAGGIFGNVTVNRKIHQLPEVENLYVHPGMSDLGISMGAGLMYFAENHNLKPVWYQKGKYK